jgi:signal transduction histidine kinase
LDLSRIAPTIAAARLTDLNGRTLAVTENAGDRGLDAFEVAELPKATKPQIFRDKNGQLEGVSPVLVNGTAVALLWLEPNHTLASSTTTVVVRIAMAYGGFALLANLLPIFLIVRSMTRPLQALRAATDLVVRGPDLNTGFPLAVTTTNEAGDLTVSFNLMVRELQEQRKGLLETLALLDSMLINAPIGFAFFDNDLRYIRVNDFLADLHGMPIEEHLGRRPTDVYPAELGEAKTKHLRQVFESGTALRNIQLSGEMPHTPGVKRSWMMHFYPVRTGQNVINWVGVSVVEITDQLRAEEALRKSEKLAATGRLAASVAHEINNPLEAVTNLLYLLHTHEGLDETAAQFVATAQEELARVSEITQQTLRFYRQSTFPGPVNITDSLRSVIRIYQPRIASASVFLVTKFGEGSDFFGFGGEIRQLFANLVGNALDAMPNGGLLRLSVHYGHGLDKNRIWCPGVRIFVTDTGLGMPEEIRSRIFEPFFTTKDSTGIGLGLWVSEEIVRKHLGTMRVRSRYGESSGTSFMIFLPHARDTVIRDQNVRPLAAE